MKRSPKILFRETKQIIPDKNLFGTSNLATNAFDVVIQLANRNRNRNRSPCSAQSQPPRRNKDRTTGHLDINEANTNGGRDAICKKNTNEWMKDILAASNGGFETDRGDGIDTDTDTDSDIPHETNGHRARGESDFVGDIHDMNGRSSAVSLTDVLEEEAKNLNKIAIDRQNTNIGKEGHNLEETQIIDTQKSNFL